jgi:hypothetical protein
MREDRRSVYDRDGELKQLVKRQLPAACAV